ncbi:MAG: hypothetical protein V7745_08240, partial [Pseudomonadales bacterium]
RGVDKDLIDQVEQEQLDASNGADQPEEQSALGQAIEQAQQGVNNPFPPLAAAEPATPLEFADFMSIFSPIAQAGEFGNDDVNLLCQQVGITTIADMVVQADKVGPAIEYLNHVIAERAK